MFSIRITHTIDIEAVEADSAPAGSFLTAIAPILVEVIRRIGMQHAEENSQQSESSGQVSQEASDSGSDKG
jgi:hypothetical protein